MNLSHVMIFIPSYFDFVRLRNYFEENTISFTSISELSQCYIFFRNLYHEIVKLTKSFIV